MLLFRCGWGRDSCFQLRLGFEPRGFNLTWPLIQCHLICGRGPCLISSHASVNYRETEENDVKLSPESWASGSATCSQVQLKMDDANELMVGFIENLQHVWLMQRTAVLHQRCSEEPGALQMSSLFLNYVTLIKKH